MVQVPEPRDRLRNLAAIRCLMVTLLLGSAIAVNINELQSFNHPTYHGLTSLIVTTYVFTVVFVLVLRKSDKLVALLQVSLAYDALLAAGIVLLTGQFGSPFAYLFLIVAMYSGVLAGRFGGLAGAGYATFGVMLVLLFEVGALRSGWVPPSLDTARSPIFVAITLASASFGVGVLSGLLAERLARATEDLAASQRNIFALRNLNERIVECLSSGLLTLDARGAVRYANPAARHLLAMSRKQLIGTSLDALGLQPAPASVGVERWESSFTTLDGRTLVLGLSSTPLHDGERNVAGQIVTFQDLSKLREVEMMLAQRERLATVGRFAASIAHEIRNPLASISGAVEMLGEGSGNEEDAALRRIMSKEIDRLNGLVTAILQYTGPRVGRREPLALSGLLDDALVLLRRDPAYAAVEMTLEVGPEVAPLSDADALRQIILNLWRNAADALEGHGRIVTSAYEAGEMVVIQVCDDGPGIPDALASNIFEPFFSTKANGTGLGLATVFQLASELGGSVRLLPRATERPLSGACFELRVPRAVQEEPDSLAGDALVASAASEESRA